MPGPFRIRVSGVAFRAASGPRLARRCRVSVVVGGRRGFRVTGVPGDATSERIRVLIVDDHLAIAEGLQALLARQSDFEMVEIANTGEAARRIASERRPHVILMDQNLSGESGVAVASAILTSGVRTSVVMFSGGMTEEELVAAVDAGASGYLMKTTPVVEIVSAIRRAASGEMLLPSAELDGLLRLGRSRARASCAIRNTAPVVTRSALHVASPTRTCQRAPVNVRTLVVIVRSSSSRRARSSVAMRAPRRSSPRIGAMSATPESP